MFRRVFLGVTPLAGFSGGQNFSPEQRAWLGIGEDESVRVLTAGARTVLLERCGGESSAALPWDRELVMIADVRAFALADLLQMIHDSAKTGFLFFEAGDHSKSIYLNRGEVIFASSNQMVDRLAQSLLRAGMISVEQFREARSSYRSPERFGKTLVQRGYLTPRQLWVGVRQQVEEIVRSLFSYGAGMVLFWEGEVVPDNAVRLALPTRRLVAEGLRRRDELLKFLARLEDPGTRLERIEGHPLTGTEEAIFAAIGTEDGFRAVCRKAGIDPLSGARTIHLLQAIGSVRLATSDGSGEEPHAGAVSLDEESLRQCVEVHVKLLAELVAPIVAVDGVDGIRDRIEGILEEASRRFPELLGGLSVGRGGMLDPEALTERALRVPGERECQVRLALGELVSYLEFELLNHAGIRDPEVFLEGLEPLRSQL